MRACALCIKRGGTITKKHVGFAKKALEDCIKHLLQKYINGTGYEERAVLVMLFHALGRGIARLDPRPWILPRPRGTRIGRCLFLTGANSRAANSIS